MVNELILKNRSYRRFNERNRLNKEQLVSLVELARLSPSSRNQQALKFLLVHDEKECTDLFNQLAWAGYLKDWPGPIAGERPAAYIVILGDTNLGKQFDTDVGIVAQSMLLGSIELGYGGCMIASLKKERIRELFSIKSEYTVELVIAFGDPIEKVVIDDCKNGEIKYWRDEKQVHHVPKRNIEEIIYKV